MGGLRRALALGLSFTLGCGAPAPEAAAARPAAPPPRPEPEPALDGLVADVLAPHHGLVVPLPDAARWTVSETERELVARHTPTGSTLRVRVMRPIVPATRQSCRDDLVARGVLPPLDGAGLVESGATSVPEGFDTEVHVGVVPPREGQPLTGFVAAVGAAPRRCFAYVFTTTAKTEPALGARLAAMRSSSLLRVSTESRLAPTIPREPLPR